MGKSFSKLMYPSFRSTPERSGSWATIWVIYTAAASISLETEGNGANVLECARVQDVLRLPAPPWSGVTVGFTLPDNQEPSTNSFNIQPVKLQPLFY